VGTVVHQDQCVRPLPGVGLSQRPRMGQTPSRAGGDRLSAVG
jgi:hypothetical protein